jgi:hypothetical protein
MKTFKEYLVENKKVYDFKIKIAGDLPENFEKNLKEKLDRCKVMTFAKVKTTPIQALPLDFPDHPNMPVSIFEIICEYPITAPEIAADIKETGLPESCFRVRGSNEPSEEEQVLAAAEPSGEALLADGEYKETGKIKHKDYFGDDFNKGFLKDLAKTAKERKKENGQGEYKLPKHKQDKEGAKSAVGS